ncbi:hypothetical protein D9M68_19800 [compost metagenome]
MLEVKQTPKQGLDNVHQEALKLLYGFATSARDAAGHKWKTKALATRAKVLIGFIKRDVEEFNKQLSDIKAGHARTITSAVLNNPHHPVMLKAGGDYFTFIDQATATLTPHSLELIDLIKEDSTPIENKATS